MRTDYVGQVCEAIMKLGEKRTMKAETFSKIEQGAREAIEIESLRSTISRLREYARHKPGCWWLRGPNCDCGYDALMAELEGSK